MSVLRVVNRNLVDLPFLNCIRANQHAAGSRQEDYVMGTRLD